MNIVGIEEASKLLGVPVSSLRYWRTQGVGPKSAKLGRRIAYRMEDIQEWVDAQFDH